MDPHAPSLEPLFERARAALARADALVITAGAGMGVDSGLPDFRGDRGFWRAYPPYEKLGLNFVDLANPSWFRRDPELGWGFYGHRLELYRATTPHPGFAILLEWAGRMRRGAFVFTSNVDGHFQRAGFDPERVVECHGAIDRMQCTRHCGVGLVAADGFRLKIDLSSMRARPPLPACPRCGALLRPNILMFGDGDWDDQVTVEQEARFADFCAGLEGAKLVVVECGAGTAVPTVRLTSEALCRRHGGLLVRLNVREPQVPPGGHLGISLGARAALEAIDRRLRGH